MAVNRLSGLTSGIDTDTMIKNLMKAENGKVDKVKQDKQIKVWEQEAYRDVIKKLKAVQDTYFDILKPDSNLKSASMFSKFTSDIKIDGVASALVTVTGTERLASLEHKIQRIDQLATKDTYTGSGLNLRGIDTGTLNFATKPTSLEVSLSIDGVAKNISVDMTSVGDTDSFVTALNTAIGTAFGNTYNAMATKSMTPGEHVKLDFKGANVRILSQTNDPNGSMAWLGVNSGTSNNDYRDKKIETLLGISEADLTSMKINGVALKDMGVTLNTTIDDLVKKVNSHPNLNATLSYSAIEDRFILSSNAEGSINQLTVTNELKDKLGLTTGVHAEAKNAIVTIDGSSVTMSKNTFEIDGLIYSLKGTYTPADPTKTIDIKLKTDTQGLVDKIKGFIEVYNGLIADFNTRISEKKNRSFLPLTDEQRKGMSDDDIKLWETKAKAGILTRSSQVQNILYQMRNALSDSVKGAGITLSEIGITTTASYKDNGKLVVDESKLKTAIENNYTKVVALFTSQSDKLYLDREGAAERYTENGIGNRISDILNDAIRITQRDSAGKKGTLLELAGIEGDSTYYKNTISEKITQYDTRINKMLSTLYDKEQSYYSQFARMEQAMAKLNSQSSWLSSQLGGK